MHCYSGCTVLIPDGCFQLAAAVSGDDDDYEAPIVPKKSKQITTSAPAAKNKKKVPSLTQRHKNKRSPTIDNPSSDDDDVVSIGGRPGGNPQTPLDKSLPTWAVIGWKRQFLPALYTALATARQPFLHYSKDTRELAATIQLITNQVYPMAKYKVVPDDPMFNIVR
jgi:hypothetical protein